MRWFISTCLICTSALTSLSPLLHQWRLASLLLFIACYAFGIIIDSSFDVAIEGPMVGIPFWVVFGAGIGLSLTYDALCRERCVTLATRGQRG